jgi:aryl-alcohol dehydrogenase-like predicted oxidoreductase
MIPSKANAIATQKFFDKHPALMSKSLGKTGLTVSACGFGAYRVDYRVLEHSDALECAILNGINLIDTSANYSDGGSEILIGKVLEKLIKEGKLKREEIVIVTKGGYIQGKNYEKAKEKKEKGESYKEVVEYSEGLWHSIHPDFLKEQITQSLEKMNIETIDVYLLHNPEYFLDSPLSKELELKELRHEYYRRIKNAFEYLETEVETGRISSYGISSNSFVYNEDGQTFSSLEECLKQATQISEQNHFDVIEFPFNLIERGAITNKNQLAGTKTLLEFAAQNNLGTLINRPLNAIRDKKLNRFADFETKEEYYKMDESQIIAEINLLDSMEEDFLKEYMELLKLSDQNREAVNYFLKAGYLLKENWKSFGSIESFNDLKKQFLIPRVNFAFTVMLKSPNLTNEMKIRLDGIARQINKLMSIIETIYGLIANNRSRDIHLKLNTGVSQSEADCFKELTLSEKAVLLINSIEGVSCTLIGMRQIKYVDDILKALVQKPISNAGHIMQELDI